jgi:rhamnose utilization protein RhaD (predicted bifunctional aldolase and dehydrogenase)
MLVQKDCNPIISSKFPNALILPYMKPGIDIFKYLFSEYKEQKIIFLKNHGVIINSNDFEDVKELIDKVIDTFTELYGRLVDNNIYKNISRIKSIMESKIKIKIPNKKLHCKIYNGIVNDALIKKLSTITFPDQVVFCGKSVCCPPCNTTNLSDDIDNYYIQNGSYPSLIYLDRILYIIGSSMSKCNETIDIINAIEIINEPLYDYDLEVLQTEEIDKLINWDAEKFRQISKN